MGNDGGDIPRRKQLVKEKKREQIATAESIAMGRSRFCNLTNEKLREPLAICRLGCIYNYENILAAMTQKTLPEKYKYIRKLSDIKKVHIEKASSESNNYIICPITKMEYNGFNKFVGLWSCGHVMSRKAFKQVRIDIDENFNEGEKVSQSKVEENVKTPLSELEKDEKSNEKKCIICERQYSDADVIDLNLEGSEMEKKRTYLIEKRNKKKTEKPIQENEGQPVKKVKVESFHLNSLDRLGGEFRDVLRERSKFKEIFKREVVEEKK